MQLNQVPQDERNVKDGKSLHKLVYATDTTGAYTGIKSAGWEAENLAMQQAWEEIDRNLAAVAEQVYEGKLSPVAYFMHKNLMDIQLLASYMGKWQWQIKRHLNPKVFWRLSYLVLERYAGIFKITVDELRTFGIEPPYAH